jgi:peptidoglycan/LPS O-acetylase OafA/YrhL
MIFLENTLNKQANNFNLLRLFLAIGVLYSHSFVLFNPAGHFDIMTIVFKQFNSGSISVGVFFLISGLLLTQSFYSTNDDLKFVIKRIFRIFPGLIVCVLITILIVGPFCTTLNLREYFLSKNTLRYLYNISLNNEVFGYHIPGVFDKNRNNIVNGSLWTLPFEFISYIFLFILLSLKKHIIDNPNYTSLGKTLIFLLCLSITCYLLNASILLHRIWGLLSGFLYELPAENNPLKLFFFFIFGSVLFFLKKKFILNWKILFLLICLQIICSIFGVFWMQFLSETATIVYSTLLIASIKWLFKFNNKIDPSFGIYLYAWPIQQITAYVFILTAYQSIIITLPITILVGLVSYRLIEKPSLNYANYIYLKMTK